MQSETHSEALPTAQDAAPTIKPPAIGQYWPGQGGIYIGLARGQNGEPDAHLIRGTGAPAGNLKWSAAVEWARAYTADGFTDFRLPERFEGALLYANDDELRADSRWCWLGTESTGSYAWNQYFSYGYQYTYRKSYEGRAVAVRRLALQSFIPSTEVA